MTAATETRAGCWCKGACGNVAAALELERAKQPALAELALKRVLFDAPACAEAHRALARLLSSTNRSAAALEHLERAMLVTGLTPDLALELARTWRELANMPAAIAAAELAANLAPDNPQTSIVLAVILHAAGERERARVALEKVRGRFAELAAARRVSAMIAAEEKDYERAAGELAGDDLGPLELFDRGRYLEKLGRYESAWSDWMEAKRRQRESGFVYDAAKVRAVFADLFDMARPPRVSVPRGCDAMPDRRPWPIFITGSPRSGTTMLEAALSAHSRIIAGDELNALPDLILSMPAILRSSPTLYPRALMATAFPDNDGAALLMRDFYLSRAFYKIARATRGAGARALVGMHDYFTDKMPSNENHWPLIRLLFPASPILHLRRHPLDILVSNMSHSLVHGYHNACALEWCAEHYALTDELVSHYRDKVPNLNVTEIRYESFVADHRAGVDSILPPELERDARCYDFHLNPWHSRTLSHRQIKEPAHSKSVGRYKPFLDFLKPVVPIIAPTMQRESYSL